MAENFRLYKPIRRAELRDAICRALGASEQQRAIPSTTQGPLVDAGEPGEFLNILVAEDNAVNQRLVARLLEKRGHYVTLAFSGREALQAIEKGNFDLVLMDIQMPEMDGFEATAVICENEKVTGTHLPVVALTAHAMKGDEDRRRAAGMDGYLTKPIRPQELDELLKKYVLRREERIPSAGD